VRTKDGLLKDFYATIDKTQLKIETKHHGFGYFEEISRLATLDYTEFKNKTYKLKLTNIQPEDFETLLRQHLDSEINICAYFDEQENSVFCFNLDCFTDDDSGIRLVAKFLRETLQKLGILPLVLKSGHGYHFWCKLKDPVPNGELQAFMEALTGIATFEAALDHADFTKLQCICYPRPLTHDISIRLFGARHIGTGVFSPVVVGIGERDELLSEADSWRYFEEYALKCAVETSHFKKASAQAAKLAAIIDNEG
jgi:hypothetical protein